jgi:prepilin-type N-terminal cleavage/methylation domain-containing protein
MNHTAKRKLAGFTLIELMIAMSVTMVLLYAAMRAFKDASQSSKQISLASDMTDNLRAGLNYLQQDLIQAGTGIPTPGIPIPYTTNGTGTCNAAAAPNRPTPPGVNAATFPKCNAVLPAIEPGQAMGPLITSPDATAGNPSNPASFTDEITMLYADNSSGLDSKPVNQPPLAPSPGCAGTIAVNGQSLTFDPTCVNMANITASGAQIQPGDLIMFSNSLGNALQVVTSASANTLNFAPGDAFGLNGRTDASGTVLQLRNAVCTTSANCWPPTTVTRIWMITYYLDNVADPTHVRLIRQVNFNPGNPVGETMENMQFTYNFVDGVNNPVNQASVPAGNTEAQIRSVSISLGARSNSLVREGNKTLYARHNLSSQVSLRSMAYVNEYF